MSKMTRKGWGGEPMETLIKYLETRHVLIECAGAQVARRGMMTAKSSARSYCVLRLLRMETVSDAIGGPVYAGGTSEPSFEIFAMGCLDTTACDEPSA